METGAPRASGEGLHALAAELFPICRSITGDGVRQTLERLGREIPLSIHEVPSGTPVFDWTVPREWNIREAWIAGPDGRRVVDFADSNLHVVGYSAPVRARMTLAELRPHLHSLPEHPDWIPYRTSYYADAWGFCLRHSLLEQLPDGVYDVCIDSSLEDGSLTYGECVVEGDTDDEILLSCHVCHPSLANDNLSGIAVATALARTLVAAPLRHTVRLLFIPGTIGAITWLALNEERARRVRHGLVLTGLGDPGHTTYKRSRRGDAPIDRSMEHVLEQSGAPYAVQDFSPYGYDERQYCSPGFDLPVGCVMRTPFGTYPQYHTSADDLDLLRPESLEDSYAKCLRALRIVDADATYLNLNPKCEPQLGRRGLYGALGGDSDRKAAQMAMLWVLNLSDGRNSLLDIANRAGLPFETVERATRALLDSDLLSRQRP